MIPLLSPPFISIVLAFFLAMGISGGPVPLGGPPKTTGYRSIIKETTGLPSTLPVSIEVYDRLNCAACDDFALSILPSLKAKYTDPAMTVIRVIVVPDPNNEDEFRAALSLKCAADQGKFGEMHALLHGENHPWNPKWFINSAKSLGMNGLDFENCLTTQKYAAELEKDFTSSEKYNVRQWPTILIGNVRLLGNQPPENIEKTVRELLP